MIFIYSFTFGRWRNRSRAAATVWATRLQK